MLYCCLAYFTMKLGKLIDTGTFSKVYMVDDKNRKIANKDNGKRVVKIVKRFSFESELEKKLLDGEIKLCSDWPFSGVDGIVGVYGVEKMGDNCWGIVMEYGGINLENFIYKGLMKKLKMENKLSVMIDLIGFLDDMEKKGYRHLDIKSKNILIGRSGYSGDKGGGNIVAKVCDFDMLIKVDDLDELGTEIVGTARYLPPMGSLDRSLSRCIWSMGIVFYEIAYMRNYNQNVVNKFGKTMFDKLIIGMLNEDIKKRFDLKDCKYELQNLLVTISK